jgi:hypothetical protein
MLLAVIVVLKLLVAEPQIMLFAGFSLYALSGPTRWVVKRLRVEMRRRDRLQEAQPPARADEQLSESRETSAARPPLELASRPGRKVGS